MWWDTGLNKGSLKEDGIYRIQGLRTMENQMEQKMRHDIETGILPGVVGIITKISVLASWILLWYTVPQVDLKMVVAIRSSGLSP